MDECCARNIDEVAPSWYFYSSMSKIEFEPGIHPTDDGDSWSMIEKTQGGDVDSHLWNGEVADRIGEYNPSIIAIDSLEPSPSINGQLSTEYMAALWSLMPDRPSKLNGTDEIFVLAGDNIYGEPDANGIVSSTLRLWTAMGMVYAGYKVSAGIYARLGARPPEPQEPGMPFTRPYDQEREDNPIYDQEREEPDTTPVLTRKQITRRRFLGMAGAGIALGVSSSALLSASAPFGFARDIAAKINDKTDDITPDRLLDPDGIYPYVDSRTALLIAKTKDAMEQRGFGDSASIIMGATHLAKADDIMNNPELRDEHIREHAKLLVAKAEGDRNFFDVRSNPRERANWILDEERLIQIFRVTEPDEGAFKADPEAELNRMIELVDQFHSPSVISATEGILDIPKS